jgi:hypothetical protein
LEELQNISVNGQYGISSKPNVAFFRIPKSTTATLEIEHTSMGTSQSSSVEVLTSISATRENSPSRVDNYGLTRKEVGSKYWSTSDVGCWLRESGLSQYEGKCESFVIRNYETGCFEKNDIDGEAINLLTDQQLKKIMGHHAEAGEHIGAMRSLLRKHDHDCEENDLVISGPTTSQTGVLRHKSIYSPIDNMSISEESMY